MRDFVSTLVYLRQQHLSSDVFGNDIYPLKDMVCIWQSVKIPEGFHFAWFDGNIWHYETQYDYEKLHSFLNLYLYSNGYVTFQDGEDDMFDLESGSMGLMLNMPEELGDIIRFFTYVGKFRDQRKLETIPYRTWKGSELVISVEKNKIIEPVEIARDRYVYGRLHTFINPIYKNTYITCDYGLGRTPELTLQLGEGVPLIFFREWIRREGADFFKEILATGLVPDTSFDIPADEFGLLVKGMEYKWRKSD